MFVAGDVTTTILWKASRGFDKENIRNAHNVPGPRIVNGVRGEKAIWAGKHGLLEQYRRDGCFMRANMIRTGCSNEDLSGIDQDFLDRQRHYNDTYRIAVYSRVQWTDNQYQTELIVKIPTRNGNPNILSHIWFGDCVVSPTFGGFWRLGLDCNL